MENEMTVQDAVKSEKNSYFDGGLLQLIGWRIVGAIVTGITFGLCFPFAVCWLYAWEAKHTVIDGKRLKFTGTAGGLFGTWLLCLVLTIVTLGIYGLYVPIKLRKWREANTFFEDELTEYDSASKLKFDNASSFDGGFWQYIEWKFLGIVVTVCTFGICYPWSVQMVYSWQQRHKVYCKKRCTFDGKAIQLLGTWIKWLLLTVITCGIYGLWIPIKLRKWITVHTHLEETESVETGSEQDEEIVAEGEVKKESPQKESKKINKAIIPFAGIALAGMLYILLPKVGYLITDLFYYRLDDIGRVEDIGRYILYNTVIGDLYYVEEERIEKREIKRAEKQNIKVAKKREKTFNKATENVAKLVDMVALPNENLLIGKTEVTQELFYAIVGKYPSKNIHINFPVENVSWYDSIYFCNKLSEKFGYTPVYSVNGTTDVNKWNYNPCENNSLDGDITQDISTNGFRLPTKEEWQYAAKGGQNYYYSGSNTINHVGWSRETETHPVAQKNPNGYGLYDMSGNVSEWVWDSYSYDTVSSRRYRCGGSYNDLYNNCEVDSSDYGYASYRNDNVGFRIVRTVTD